MSSQKKYDATVAKVESALKVVGNFVEQKIDQRTRDAFTAAGGKYVKRFIAGEKGVSCEILVSVSGADEWTSRISFPVTAPLTKDQMQDLAPTALLMSSAFIPANLNVSAHGRLMLTYQDTDPCDKAEVVASHLAWRLTEGNRIATSMRAEMKRNPQGPKAFDPDQDKVWQSEMGKPVKLTAAELQIVAGGGWKWWAVNIAKAAGGIVGGIGGGLTTPVTGPGGAWGGAIVGGGAAAESAEGIWDLPPSSTPPGPVVSKGAYCFAGETPVHTTNGLVRIDALQVGDVVVSSQGGEPALSPVAQIESHLVNAAMISLVVDGSAVAVTENHAFLTVGGWKMSQDLAQGDQLLTASGIATVASATRGTMTEQRVFNVVTVSGIAIVGQAGLIAGAVPSHASRAIAG